MNDGLGVMRLAPPRLRGVPFVGAVLLGLAGCVGSVGDSGPSGGSNPPSMPGSNPGKPPVNGMGDPGVAPPPAVAAGACGTPVFSATLTREQYVNTVTDLLGFDVRPLVSFTDTSGRTYKNDFRLPALQVEGLLNTAAAIADAAVTPANLKSLVPCDGTGANASACADQFIDKFGARATRRPLSADAKADLRALFDAGNKAGGFTEGVKWVVDGLLQSPDVFYHLVLPAGTPKGGTVVALNDFEIADRLAYFLWNSGPDEGLFEAASRSSLRTADQIAAQVTRMKGDPRMARSRQDFYRNWLNLDIVSQLTRDDAAYTPDLAKSLTSSILAGIDAVYQGDGKSDTLFSSPNLFVDPVLAKVYGLAATGTGMSSVAAGDQRRGLLTHPALMAAIAEHDTSDPIHRGTFVYTRALCQSIPDPPNAVPDLPPLAPNVTTRQRLEMHRANPACGACHQLFDPIGLAFEGYDSLGRFRTEEHGAKVDSSGEIKGDVDVTGAFPDGFTLFGRLAQSKSVRSCMAQTWYQYGSRRDLDATDACAVDAVKSRFAAGGDLNDLLVSIATSESFRNRLVTE
jgi:hypothetical protein